MNIDALEIVKFIVENYGLAGFALLFWVWHGWQQQKKLDRLQSSCNKMFGIVLAIADKRTRDDAALNKDKSERLVE